jgi:pilus assembly protein CpaC
MCAQISTINSPIRYGPVWVLLAAVIFVTAPDVAAQSSPSREWKVKSKPPEPLLLNDSPVGVVMPANLVTAQRPVPEFSPITPVEFVVPQTADDANSHQAFDSNDSSVVPPAVVPESAQRRDASSAAVPGAPRRRSRGSAESERRESSGASTNYVINETSSENVLTLFENRPRILKFRTAPVRTYIPEAGGDIIAIRFVDPDSATQVAIEPLAVGSTVLTLWFPNPQAEDGEESISWLVNVTEDPQAGRRYEELLSDLERDVNRAFPNSAVTLTYVGSQVVVRGQAKDVEEATQILRIVSASLPNEDIVEKLPVNLNEVGFFTVPTQRVEDAGSLTGAFNGDTASGVNQGRINNRIVNLLEIAGVHQIMLKVTVAEVNRSASRAIGANLEFGSAGDAARFFTSLGAPAGGASFVVNRGDFDLAIRALKEMNLARSLAEPTLTTLNGQPANFNVGGSFPVPVVTGQTAAGLQGVEFQQYGVQLNFVPIVTDHDRIRLTLQANVSTRDESAGTQFGESDVPGLNSRTFQNTVELREGETIAVAGLIQTNVGSRSRRMPFLGDLPFVRRLFSNDGTSYDEQELIVLVTPYLVNPVDTKATPIALPGSDYYEPDDVEFFLKGSLTGHLDEDYRSPVRTDIHKMKAFRRCEQKMIIGQPGHSNGLLCPPGLSAAETSLPAYSGVQP